jgi:DNA-directed RNA polymerase specialized sigma24 family protein
MAPGEIETIAQGALRVAIKRSGILWPVGQPEEAYQEACLAILQAERFKPDASQGYLFAAALNGIVGFQRRLYRKRIDYVHGVDLDVMAAPAPNAAAGLIRRLPELAGLLRRQRKWLTVDTTHEVERELAFLRLRLIGYDLDEIAAKMGYTYGAAVAMSARLLERLQRIADGVIDVPYRRPGPPPTPESTARMLAASRTPEARAKHSATLRVACNTPEGRLRMAAAARARWGNR